ncbi:MAG: hypothetical protein AAFQ98_17315 [Bacteroidota bacterium]
MNGTAPATFLTASHYYAASQAEVLSVLNAKLAPVGHVAVAVNAINFLDDPRFSFAVVEVMLSTGTPREVFTLFRYTDQVSVDQSGSGVFIDGGLPSQNFVDGGLGINSSEITVECGSNGCTGGRCKFGEVSLHLVCYCNGGGGGGDPGPGNPQATDVIVITDAAGCKTRVLQ